MSTNILVNGKPLQPLFTSSDVSGPAVHGEDEQGQYVAYRLSNKITSHLYGWNILVSPEDLPLMEDHRWCGNVSGNAPHQCVNVRRRERVKKKDHCVHLSREVWKRMYGEEPPSMVWKKGHPLDFRREKLTLEHQGMHVNGCRGITAHKVAGWQVQITVESDHRYIGCTQSAEEGFRMFNRYLRTLKKRHPHHMQIQAMAYNRIEPQF